MPSRTGPPTVAGRWSRLPPRGRRPDPAGARAGRGAARRHGVVTRGAVMAERVPGGFAAVYPVLRAVEDPAGPAAATSWRGWARPSSPPRRGRPAPPYATDRLPAARRADPGEPGGSGGTAGAGAGGGAGRDRPGEPVRRGAAVAGRPADGDGGRGHRPGRKAGALVVLVDGAPGALRRARRPDPAVLDRGPGRAPAAADALALAVREGALGRLTVERADGEGVHASPPGRGARRRRLPPHPAGPAPARLTTRLPAARGSGPWRTSWWTWSRATRGWSTTCCRCYAAATAPGRRQPRRGLRGGPPAGPPVPRRVRRGAVRRRRRLADPRPDVRDPQAVRRRPRHHRRRPVQGRRARAAGRAGDQGQGRRCTVIDLDSGVQRHDAHRFYFRERMHISSHHFTKALDE